MSAASAAWSWTKSIKKGAMKMKGRNVCRSKAGLSAIVGIILIVVIVIAIAATMYVCVTGMMEQAKNNQNNDTYFSYTGRFNGIKENDCYNLKVGNHTIKGVYGITQNDYLFLMTLSGKNCTFSFYTHRNTTYYIEAYLN
jgi:hypothetical protein